jgi:tetratricopeptide (TPR) repeat protein
MQNLKRPIVSRPNRAPHRPGRRTLVLLSVLVLSISAAGAGRSREAQDQVDFGVKAAKKGLWREARFRWEKALKLAPADGRVLNNLAVACEVAGEFDQADQYYRRALQGDPGNDDIQQNYTLFSAYYKTVLSRREQEPAAPAPPPAPPEEPDAPDRR